MAAGMFERFLVKAKEGDCGRLASQEEDGTFRHLQVRLTGRDAKRVRCLADMRDLSIQDALVAALNALLVEWGQQPVMNPGTRKRSVGGS